VGRVLALVLFNGSSMLSVSSTYHSVVFALWLSKFFAAAGCCLRYAVFCSLNIYCNTVIVVLKHVDKNSSENGHA
jgi:hypothetical protein